MTKHMIYKMYYISGGGTEYDGGLWKIHQTPKTYTFICIKKSFYEGGCPFNMKIKKENGGIHFLQLNDDKSFTIYPYRNGKPHIFESVNHKVKGELNEEKTNRKNPCKDGEGGCSL
mgnify:CR=1 FL=1